MTYLKLNSDSCILDFGIIKFKLNSQEKKKVEKAFNGTGSIQVSMYLNGELQCIITGKKEILIKTYKDEV